MTESVLVIGGTGGVGREVLARGLASDAKLTALVRSPHKIAGLADRVAIVRGDPLDPSVVARAAAGTAAVITCLGGVLADGARALVTGLASGGPRRVAMVSAAMLFEDAGSLALVLRTTILRGVARDSREAEKILAASALDWTVVRPPRLTNGPATGRWHVAIDHLPDGGAGSISRADVADCVLREVARADHVRRVVGVAISSAVKAVPDRPGP